MFCGKAAIRASCYTPECGVKDPAAERITRMGGNVDLLGLEWTDD